MRQHLLYLSGPDQSRLARVALQRLGAKHIADQPGVSSRFELQHRLLGKMLLDLTLITDIDAVTPHLRHHPIDLLIYDERGEDAMPAYEAALKIRDSAKLVADLWGPDFVFPMSRVVGILARDEDSEGRSFQLGRLNVRDVCVAPKNTVQILLWLKDILWDGVYREPIVGLGLGGGGIEGFLYEIGVLYALEQAITGKRTLKQCNYMSGVSSGAIAGTIFASKLPMIEVIHSLNRRSTMLPSLTSMTIFDLAGTEITKRVVRESISWAGLNPKKWIDKTFRSVPTGFFKGDSLEEYFRAALGAVGQEDSFSAFETKLLVGATDQDTYEHVILGELPWDDVPVSAALRASCALPPVYLPKQIRGRWFIDGQVTRSSNLELLVDKGCRLVVVVNPLKPHAMGTPGETDQQGGLFGVIQTIKALISTRFEGSLRHVAERYPDVDFVVFEPDEECARLMSGSPMRYRIRTELMRHAYRSTIRTLRDRHQVYASKLGRHGFTLVGTEQLKQLECRDHEVFE